jgi:hypothetical protein
MFVGFAWPWARFMAVETEQQFADAVVVSHHAAAKGIRGLPVAFVTSSYFLTWLHTLPEGKTKHPALYGPNINIWQASTFWLPQVLLVVYSVCCKAHCSKTPKSHLAMDRTAAYHGHLAPLCLSLSAGQTPFLHTSGMSQWPAAGLKNKPQDTAHTSTHACYDSAIPFRVCIFFVNRFVALAPAVLSVVI